MCPCWVNYVISFKNKILLTPNFVDLFAVDFFLNESRQKAKTKKIIKKSLNLNMQLQ